MTPLLRNVAFLASAGILVSTSAMASVPSAANSDVPCGIVLVGTLGGVPDAAGEFTIIVRDQANNPIGNARVEIVMCDCVGSGGEQDIRLCANQTDPDVTSMLCEPQCKGGLVTANTDGAGQVTLTLTGAANNLGSGDPAAPFNCGSVYVEGVNLGSMNVAAYDENGAGGVNPADLSVWLSDSFSPLVEGRSDFNCTNTVNPADLSILLGASLNGGSQSSCVGGYCF
jgi:hypothetical protein